VESKEENDADRLSYLEDFRRSFCTVEILKCGQI